MVDLETAVSDKDGGIDFYTSGANAGLTTTSLEYASLLANETNIESKIEVKCRRLDSILDEHGTEGWVDRLSQY